MAQELALAGPSKVVEDATSDIYGLLKQQISYVFKYQNYINDLKKQVQELRNKRQMVQKPVESAERQGEEIYELVTTWLNDVHEFTEEVAKSIIEDEDKANKGGCFKLASCPDLIQRYRLGKKAMKATINGADLLGKGNFSHVSYRPALQRTESMYVRGYEAFDSRMQVLQEIMDTLKDANVNMIGVYGMGGVGKTTLVRKVAWLARENKLFDEVAVAEVTQTPDYKKVQEKIAFDLGLEFGQEGEYQRGGLLRNRIKKEKNVLVIFDDIWTKVDLDAIGIPSRGADKQGKDDKVRRCVVLLTSRNLDVLKKDMKILKNIPVHPLSDGDSWNLFGKIVGD
ncbi:probable disease resistance protein At5g43730 [Pistacia vera]|uniref:probable disease resistance protein At5g43730 n=1 Tax=Pistacia vera TaxID=55513 RepID=UPI0012634968|nr:probable disease resistance protein At5g43730 [Pistacia vera]